MNQPLSEVPIRELLLDHALTLFSQRGYTGTGVREIVAAAGVKQPTLYYYFKDKTGLFQALIERYYGEPQASLEARLKSIDSTWDRLRLMVRSSFEYCVQDPRIPRLMFQTYFGPRTGEIDGVLDRHSDQRFSIVRDTMKRGVKRKELKASDPEFLAFSFCCLMDQSINLFCRRVNPGEFLTKELADSLVELFAKGAQRG